MSDPNCSTGVAIVRHTLEHLGDPRRPASARRPSRPMCRRLSGPASSPANPSLTTCPSPTQRSSAGTEGPVCPVWYSSASGPGRFLGISGAQAGFPLTRRSVGGNHLTRAVLLGRDAGQSLPGMAGGGSVPAAEFPQEICAQGGPHAQPSHSDRRSAGQQSQ